MNASKRQSEVQRWRQREEHWSLTSVTRGHSRSYDIFGVRHVYGFVVGLINLQSVPLQDKIRASGDKKGSYRTTDTNWGGEKGGEFHDWRNGIFAICQWISILIISFIAIIRMYEWFVLTPLRHWVIETSVIFIISKHHAIFQRNSQNCIFSPQYFVFKGTDRIKSSHWCLHGKQKNASVSKGVNHLNDTAKSFLKKFQIKSTQNFNFFPAVRDLGRKYNLQASVAS